MNVELKEFISSSSPSKNQSQLCREEGLAVSPTGHAASLCLFPGRAQDNSQKDTSGKAASQWGAKAGSSLLMLGLLASLLPASKGGEYIFNKQQHCSAQGMAQGGS